MIQRKQTLFLLQLAFLSLSLLFIPSQVKLGGEPQGITLIPITEGGISSTTGHLAAIALNALGLILAFITIFLFKKRELQVKLCYVLAAIYLIIPVMMAFCPFVQPIVEGTTVQKNIFGYIICAVAVLSAILAARFIKKDIELLKSADRIR